jgi:hypothetical protein
MAAHPIASPVGLIVISVRLKSAKNSIFSRIRAEVVSELPRQGN